MSDVSYLIFDVETVGDGNLIQQVRYPEERLSPREAVARYRSQLLEETGKDILPLTFVLPVSVAVAKVRSDFSLIDVSVLDHPHYRPEQIVRGFWQGWNHYQRPTFVTFNGRGYDIPVMEVAAFRFGIGIPAWFNIDSRSFEQARNRYNQSAHLDLQDLLTNFSAFRMNGGLNLLAHLIHRPGKAGIDGSLVQDMFYDGKVDEINDYCRCDVLDTYFVFLRTQVLLGRITTDDEHSLTADARNLLESKRDQHKAYQTYLEYWDRRLADQMDVSHAIGGETRPPDTKSTEEAQA